MYLLSVCIWRIKYYYYYYDVIVEYLILTECYVVV